MTLDAVIFNDYEEIKCKYYEIEDKCIEIINKYCSLSSENNQKFLEFAKNYKTFKPYFDFVVCVLGYKIKNIELEENKVLMAKDNKMYVYKTLEEKLENNYRYSLSDNKTLNIKPIDFNITPYREAVIYDNLDIYPEVFLGHEHIFKQILNNLLISNQSVCEDYLSYKGNIGFFLLRYLPIIWFQSERLGRKVVTKLVYYESNMTSAEKEFIEYLLDNQLSYPSSLLKLDTFAPFDTKNYQNSLEFIESSEKHYGKK